MNAQEELTLVWGVTSAPKVYPLYPPVSDKGILALSDLNEFCRGQLDPLLGISTETIFLLDFSRVKIWDISAVLWLAIALQFYRGEKLAFQLRLPEGEEGSTPVEREEFKKSADFLRRWRFDVALAHVGELESIMVPHQVGYFVGGPRDYYTEESLKRNPDGLLERWLSNRLMEIRDLTQEDTKTRRKEVSDDEIQRCIRRFQDSKIGNILFNNCEIKMDDADCFADSLITEALLNTKQHPNATTGLMALAVLGNSRELILAVADNGDSIASTILDTFNQKHGTAVSREALAASPLHVRATIIHYATQPYVSRKPPKQVSTDEDVGLGLTYIKRDTVDKFGGKLRILRTEIPELAYCIPCSTLSSQTWRGNPGFMVHVISNGGDRELFSFTWERSAGEFFGADMLRPAYRAKLTGDRVAVGRSA
jgi:hypothetical protein